MPWPELQAVVKPVYPKVSEAGGRAPIPLERMLRIYFLQLWFNLSDPAVEDALYDSEPAPAPAPDHEPVPAPRPAPRPNGEGPAPVQPQATISV